VFSFFKRKVRDTHKALNLTITVEKEHFFFEFYVESQGVEKRVPIPFSEEDFREYTSIKGYECYWAYEVLMDEGLMVNERLAFTDYYALLENPDFNEVLEVLNLHRSFLNLEGLLKISGTPALEPDFDLQLYVNQKNLQQIADVRLPLIYQDGACYYIPKDIFKLWKAIESNDYESGYEKTAIVQQLAVQAHITLDNFLEREAYHIVDSYQIEPKLVGNETLQLSIVGNTEQETTHLNTTNSRSSVKRENMRERYVTPKNIAKDVQKIRQKSIFKGEEIPTLLQNPEAFFPDLTQPFDLEKFSDRVTGFVKVVRPTPMTIDGKRAWFDNETGEELILDEELLRQDILAQPEQKFVQHQKNWVYVDKQLKEVIGLTSSEEQVTKDRYALEIKGNEERLTYNLSKNDQTTIQEYELPAKTKATLFAHQREGYNWLCSLYEQGFSGLLADDMGLGKTIQVLTFMQRQFEQQKLFPALIVLPIALIENWVNEIEKFAPELSSKIYIHKGASRIKNLEMLEQQQLIFTSYDTLKIDQLLLGQIAFECIILDEAQNIKTNGSSRSRAIRAMQGKFRLAMTGTPVENSLEELWTIMDFVEPGALGALSIFKKQYIKNENYEELKQALQKYYLRRTKDEVMREHLPTKHLLQPIYVQASPLQMELAASMLTNVRAKTSSLLSVIGSLRVLYAHPKALMNLDHQQDIPPKFEAVMKILREVQRKNEKVLIFTEFKKVQAFLKRAISEEFHISVPVINGETDNRSEVVKYFNKQEGFGVMLLSPKAAGVGLTITGANHVIHYTRWWNPAVENQATDRAYRIGQQKDVYVYQIITQDSTNFPDGTVEEIMHQILSDKAYLADNVIVPFDTTGIQEKVKQTIEKQQLLIN